MKNYKTVVIAFLLGVTIYSSFRYVVILKEKYIWLKNINELKTQLQAQEGQRQTLMQSLEKERGLQQKLSQENVLMQESLKTSEEKIAKLTTDFIQAQKIIEQLNSQIFPLQNEIAVLKQENGGLAFELNQLLQEKESLKSTLSSVSSPVKETTQSKEKGKEKKQSKKEETFTANSVASQDIKIEVLPVQKGQNQ